ncbi:MAG: MarR family transcriptional regulator [bacterium]
MSSHPAQPTLRRIAADWQLLLELDERSETLLRGELAERLGRHPRSVSWSLQQLREAGLVEAQPDPHHRARYTYRLSSLGREWMEVPLETICRRLLPTHDDFD